MIDLLIDQTTMPKKRSLFAQRFKTQQNKTDDKGFPTSFKIEVSSTQIPQKEENTNSSHQISQKISNSQSDLQLPQTSEQKLPETKFDILSKEDAIMITQQNLQMVQKMSPKEIKEQQEILKGMLSSKTLELIQQRKNYLLEGKKYKPVKNSQNALENSLDVSSTKKIEKISFQNLQKEEIKEKNIKNSKEDFSEKTKNTYPKKSDHEFMKGEIKSLKKIFPELEMDYYKTFTNQEILKRAFFNKKGENIIPNSELLQNSTNHFNPENNDEFFTLEKLLTLLSSSVVQQAILSLDILKKIFLNLESNFIILKVVSEENTNRSETRKMPSMLFWSEFLSRAELCSALSYFSTKKNSTLLSSVLKIILTLLKKIYGYEKLLCYFEADPELSFFYNELRAGILGSEAAQESKTSFITQLLQKGIIKSLMGSYQELERAGLLSQLIALLIYVFLSSKDFQEGFQNFDSFLRNAFEVKLYFIEREQLKMEMKVV